jgi:hypothetical protein
VVFQKTDGCITCKFVGLKRLEMLDLTFQLWICDLVDCSTSSKTMHEFKMATSTRKGYSKLNVVTSYISDYKTAALRSEAKVSKT